MLALGLVLATGCASRGARVPLDIEAPKQDLDAEVYVDGNFVGLVQDVSKPDAPILLGEGKHRVEIRKPGRFPYQRTVEVARGARAPVTVSATLLEDPP